MKQISRVLAVVLFLILTVSILPNSYILAKTKKIEINKKNVTMVSGGKTRLKLKGAKKVIWESSNNKIATVKKGVVTAKAKGKAVITAKSNGKKATCKITVKSRTGFEKPYNTKIILAYAKEYAESIGMTWNTEMTPDNCSWEAPPHMSSYTVAELKEVIQVRIRRVKKLQEDNGYKDGEFHVRLYLKSIKGNDYLMYFLMG